MSEKIKLPGLGEGIDSIEVIKIRVKPGDKLEKDQVIMDLESGKAVLELPTPVAGVVGEILIKEGEEVSVGDELMTVKSDDSNGAGEDKKAKPEKQKKKQEPKEPAKPEPEKKEEVEKKAEPAKPEKKKTAKQSKAPTKKKEAKKAEEIEVVEETETDETSSKVPASPLVRRMARQLGVDLNAVKGSGSDGRVLVDDITAAVGQGAVGGLPDLPDFGRWGNFRREKMTKVRYETARQVTRCWSQIPMVTQFAEANVSNLLELKDKFADEAKERGGTLTMAVMMVKIVSEAIREFPQFNASIDMVNRQLIYREYCNIGIAVSTEHGLFVPVLKDLDKKDIVQLAVDVSAIARKARAGKLAPQDMQGGCFTVTNLGNIAGSYFTPIVNYPEVGILGMGRASTQAVYISGAWRPEVILPLSLSYDHRMIDGADAARFIKWLITNIESPAILEE